MPTQSTFEEINLKRPASAIRQVRVTDVCGLRNRYDTIFRNPFTIIELLLVMGRGIFKEEVQFKLTCLICLV